jgi:hypothetical protein
MNEPRPVPPQGLPQTNPHGTAAPRPAGVQPLRPPAAPIAPAQPQRLPQQGNHGTGAGQPLPSRIPAIPGVVHRAMPAIPVDGADELINLEDEDTASPAPAARPGGIAQSQISAPSKIKFASGGDKHAYTKFKRQTQVTGHGASRIRSFHGRLSDDGLAFMDDKINEWLDNHPEIEVKLVNTIVGPLEGKVTGEQGLIVTIWY